MNKIPILQIREKGSDEWKDIQAIRGLSAYQIWLKQPGNAGKAEAEFIASLKGAPGSIENIDEASLEFTVAATRENINTGETFADLFGKVAKWFTSLKALAFKDKVDYDSDIDNKPTIPTQTSQLSNNSGFQTSTQVTTSINTHNASGTAHSDIRTALQALQSAGFQTSAQVQAAINSLINGAPGALDTLQELATAMGNDPNFATTITNELATKAKATEVSSALAEKVDKVEDKALSSNDFTDEYKEALDYDNGGLELTSVVAIPSTKKRVFITISANAALSFAEVLSSGEQTIFIYNSSASSRTITLPSSTSYVNPFGTSLAIPATSYAEVNRSYMKEGVNNIRAAV